MVEGVEIPDQDKHRDLWYHMGKYQGSHVDELHFSPHSVEDLAEQKLAEEIELPEDDEWWSRPKIAFPQRRNSETILHTIVMGYVWSKRMKIQALSLWDEPYHHPGINPAEVTSDHIPLEYLPVFLPE